MNETCIRSFSDNVYLNVGYSKGGSAHEEKQLSVIQPDIKMSEEKSRASVSNKDVTTKPKIAPKPRAASSETYYNMTSEDYYNSAEFVKGIHTDEFKAYVAKKIQKEELLAEYKVDMIFMRDYKILSI